jgi:hypothetical protein
MIRKFFISSNTVFEQVLGGVRAVSPFYNTKDKAEAALSFLKANPHIANVKQQMA